MIENTSLPLYLPAVERKKVSAGFAGGSISSDGGLVLLRAAERRLGLAEALAGCIREWRDPDRVVRTLPAMLRFRMFAIACGHEDADDCDAPRGDPLFKLAVGRAPRGLGTLTAGATCSKIPRPFNPEPRHRKPQTPMPKRRRTGELGRDELTNEPAFPPTGEGRDHRDHGIGSRERR